MLALSEAISSSAAARCRCCRPSAAGCSSAPLRRLGFRIPDELTNLLRFGRGLDNRLYKATGFRYGYTTRETVLKLGEHLRLEPILRGRAGDEAYRYEREVEEFLRWSPHVRRERASEGVAADREPLGI